MLTSDRTVPNLTPSPWGEGGSLKPAPVGHFPNLPNLPNVFLTCVHVGACVRARFLREAGMSVFGWEGWEGWEELAVVGFSDSHPLFKGWERLGIGDVFQEVATMEEVISKMRADFVLVAKACEWPDEDRNAANAEIRRLVAAKDYSKIRGWAFWLAELAVRVVRDSDAILQPPALVQCCADCEHFRRPGRTDGLCGGRDDLPLHYGPDHPLRVLPADDGRSCAHYRMRGAR